MGERALEDGAAEAVRTYWRRRFIILVIGLAVFASLAWGLSVAFSPSPSALPGAGTGPAGGGHAAGPGNGVAAATSPSASASTGPGPGAGTSASPSASGQPPGGAIVPPYCSRKNIVLSLSPDQADFISGQVASFSVNVVSTASGDCSFNLGPEYLAVVVSEGSVRIWSSADCVHGNGGLLTALKRGVPTVLQITWTRKTSAPGCAGPVNQVPAGSYTAVAVQGGLISSQVTFSLG